MLCLHFHASQRISNFLVISSLTNCAVLFPHIYECLKFLFVIIASPSFRLVTFVLKSIVSNISIAIQGFLWSRFSPMLYSRSFIVLHFAFRSAILFRWYISMKGIWSGLDLLIFLHMGVQFFQHQLFKTLSLSHCIVFAPLSNIC